MLSQVQNAPPFLPQSGGNYAQFPPITKPHDPIYEEDDFRLDLLLDFYTTQRTTPAPAPELLAAPEVLIDSEWLRVFKARHGLGDKKARASRNATTMELTLVTKKCEIVTVQCSRP